MNPVQETERPVGEGGQPTRQPNHQILLVCGGDLTPSVDTRTGSRVLNHHVTYQTQITLPMNLVVQQDPRVGILRLDS